MNETINGASQSIETLFSKDKDKSEAIEKINSEFADTVAFIKKF
jgi:hypothetical protein